jgi:hypothetical protein
MPADTLELVNSITANAAPAHNPYQINPTMAVHPIPRRGKKFRSERHWAHRIARA